MQMLKLYTSDISNVTQLTVDNFNSNKSDDKTHKTI